MDIFFIFILLTSIVFLYCGANLLIKYSLEVCRKLNLSELFVGLTIVAWGTSLPELFVIINSITTESGSILAYGTIMGSNIANISLILGLAMLCSINSFSFTSNIIKSHSLIGIAATVFFVAYITTSFKNIQDLLPYLMIFAVFIYVFFSYKGQPAISNNISIRGLGKTISLLIFGGFLLWVGCFLLVQSGHVLMETLGVPEMVVGGILFALSTSSPEIVSSIVSIIKYKKSDLVIGNILGSNISNIFIFGLLSSFHNFDIKPQFEQGSLLLVAELILLGVFFLKRKNDKIEIPRFFGIFFIGIYCIFIKIVI